jgi:hypothetical protein
VGPRQLHDLAHEIQVHAGCGGVMGKRDQQELRLLGSPVQILETVQKRGRVRHGQHARLALGHNHTVLVDGVRRVGRYHYVARPHSREQQVRQGVLGADGDNGFRIGIQRDAITGLVALGNLFSQLGNAARLRVPVVAGVARRLDKLVHHGARRSAIRVAHAQIDDVDLRGAGLCPHLVDDRKNVRRQLPNPIEILGRIGAHLSIVNEAGKPLTRRR